MEISISYLHNSNFYHNICPDLINPVMWLEYRDMKKAPDDAAVRSALNLKAGDNNNDLIFFAHVTVILSSATMAMEELTGCVMLLKGWQDRGRGFFSSCAGVTSPLSSA